ncbi:hypothetical protein [Stieleria mannarensis]|uniref:hypothetical protein n=1 Tax=Stieleria mannarensis TaxID=2755585 RepID=UPI0016027545|nr:hypothetical protein [Rhodopirellula sp. JC639]
MNGMTRVAFGFVAYLVLFTCTIPPTPLHADEPLDAREQERQQRLEYLTGQARGYAMSLAGQPDTSLSLEERPVLRYTNPVRNFFTDGVVFLWRHDSEPAVLGALSVRGDGNVFCEFASLTSNPLHCELGLRRAWTPKKESQVNVPLKVRLPQASDTRRQTLAMRQLIRRFSVSMYEVEDPDQKQQLRRLTSPLVQWSDPSDGSLIMCFGFAETNDPEALVLLHHTPNPDGKADSWTYTLSRMTSRPLAFELDGKVIHEVKPYWKNPQSDTDSYLERRLGEYPTDGS